MINACNGPLGSPTGAGIFFTISSCPGRKSEKLKYF
jgi:hypothetical protein